MRRLFNEGYFRVFLWGPSLIWLSVIVYLSVSPAPDAILPFPGYDKILHFCAYAILSVFFAIPRAKKPLWFRIIFIPAVIGITLELVQINIPFRSPDILDCLANVVGSSCAYCSITLIKKVHARRGR